MLCSTATYSSGTHAPPPSTNVESIYPTNGANANKGLLSLIIYLNSLSIVLDYWTPTTTYDEPVCLIKIIKILY
jgi:hypothetical protein